MAPLRGAAAPELGELALQEKISVGIAQAFFGGLPETINSRILGRGAREQ
jgi:hypothetical protein